MITVSRSPRMVRHKSAGTGKAVQRSALTVHRCATPTLQKGSPSIEAGRNNISPPMRYPTVTETTILSLTSVTYNGHVVCAVPHFASVTSQNRVLFTYPDPFASLARSPYSLKTKNSIRCLLRGPARKRHVMRSSNSNLAADILRLPLELRLNMDFYMDS